MFALVAASLVLLPIVAAHFQVEYPTWRDNTFNAPGNQWIWPCGNYSSNSTTPRTPWPQTGGSILLDVHHAWAPTYINIGIGDNVNSFNITLLDHFNQTGNGTFCLSSVGKAQLAQLSIPDGTHASIQVVQISTAGNALYNCADIVFQSSAAPLNSSTCVNSTGVAGVTLTNAGASSGSSSSGGNSSSASSGNSTKTGDATGLRASGLLVGGAAVLFGALMA